MGSVNQMTKSMFDQDEDVFPANAILAQERAGYNVIVTDIKPDIMNTLEVRKLINLLVSQWLGVFGAI